MTDEADIFGAIRIKRKSKKKKRKAPASPASHARKDEKKCAWEGCQRVGIYPAPKKHHKERYDEQTHRFFCLEHIQEYNKKYNFFLDMTSEDILAFNESAPVGHRPTWREPHPAGTVGSRAFQSLQARHRARTARSTDGKHPKRKVILSIHQKALHALHLEEGATSEEIKARYKKWLKICHPDLNLGDHSAQQRLQEVIEAYRLLEKAGFV